MTRPPSGAPPTPGRWRARLRHLRRGRRQRRPLGDRLTDLYAMLWLLVLYGGVALSEARRFTHTPPPSGSAAVERQWIVAAALLACGGLLWQALRALGPLIVTPAEQTWGISTPLDRAGWLAPRCTVLLALVGLAGAAVATLAVFGAFHGPGLALAGVGGTAVAVTVAGGSVAAQAAPVSARWRDAVGHLLLAIGALVASAAVGAHFGGWQLPAAPPLLGPTLVGLPLAAAGVVAAVRSLPRLDRIALGSGADLAGAVVAATVWIDPSLLHRALELRRARRIGRVTSGALLPAPAGLGHRAWALLQAEFRRSVRRPFALAAWGALALAHYALVVVAPSLGGPSLVIGTYFAAGLFVNGLRTVARSEAVRRMLGGRNRDLLLLHVVTPAIAGCLWWVGARPAGGPAAGAMELVLIAGAIGAAYRAATPPPRTYDGPVVDTPVGMLPVGILTQVARGPDLLGAVIVLQILLAR